MDELLFGGMDDTYGNEICSSIVQKNLQDRRIVLNQTINDDQLEYLCLTIVQWNKEDKYLPVDKRKKIYIYINSDGGDMIIGTQILSIIKESKTPVVTVGFAKCSSMASYILAAGHERYCFPNTIVLFHDGERGFLTSGTKGKDISKFFEKLDAYMDNFVLSNTSMSPEFLEEIRDREYYMWADEAKEKGFVDKIIGIDCDLEEIL